jgi:hypothetical protein
MVARKRIARRPAPTASQSLSTGSSKSITRACGTRQLVEGVVQGFGEQCRVEPREGIAQALHQDHLPVVVAFGRGFAGGDLGADSATSSARAANRRR